VHVKVKKRERERERQTVERDFEYLKNMQQQFQNGNRLRNSAFILAISVPTAHRTDYISISKEQSVNIIAIRSLHDQPS